MMQNEQSLTTWNRVRAHIPNSITVLRILCILPLCWYLWHDAYVSALIILLVASISDGLDGFLARRLGLLSHLGALLDPLADKLFIILVTLTLSLKGLLPLWFLVLVLGRDLVILLGATAYWRLTGELQIKPLTISKINTVLQMLLLVLVLLHNGFYPALQNWTQGLQTVVAFTTLYSGIGYVFLWTKYSLEQE